MFTLNSFNFRCCVRYCFFPAYFLPRILNAFSYHWGSYSILVSRIAPSKPSLNTRMAMIRSSILIWSHSYYLISLNLGIKRTTYTTICTSSSYRPIRDAIIDNRFFNQSSSWASLNTSPTRYTL